MYRPGELPLRETVTVGVVQTTLDYRRAWPAGPPMSEEEAQRARVELQRAVAWFGTSTPDFLLLPELALARPHVEDLADVCRQSGSIVIAGIDYRLDESDGTARNEALLLIPPDWPRSRHGAGFRRSGAVQRCWIGKTYPSAAEEGKLKTSSPHGWQFVHDPRLWLFDADAFGRFGVAICYDMMDVERFVMYRGEIHHLFVLAYNRDISSFGHIAEAICRTLYCNVVVCNTGFYGGSLTLSPWYQPYRRPSYRVDGQALFAAQEVVLPLASLDQAWLSGPAPCPDNDPNRLKGLPPGFRRDPTLAPIRAQIIPTEEQGPPSVAGGETLPPTGVS